MKSVVLLSGGLDSATNLYIAHQKTQIILAITFDYGQRVAAQEAKAASELCRRLSIPHKVLSIPWVKEFGGSSLTDINKTVPQGGDVNIEDLNQSRKSATSVWVPNRNGILLNIAAGFAEALGADCVIPGFNIEEAQTFPDNTVDFLDALSESFSYSTASQVKALCFTTELNKTQIVAEAANLKLPFELLWPCYMPGEKWCGQCESCLRFRRALEQNNLLSRLKINFI